MADTVQPVRLRLSRARGFNLQAHSMAVNGLPAVNCARPSKWGNPFNWCDGLEMGNEAWAKGVAVALFREWAMGHGHLDRPGPPRWRDLRGYNLACWCGPNDPCHVDVELEIANA